MKENSAKIVPIYAAAAAVIAAAVRFFQYVSLIDYGSGFFIKGSELAGCLLYILFGAAAIGFIVFSAVRKKKGDAAYFLSSDAMGDKATQPLGISYLVAGVACLFELTNGSSDIWGQLLSIIPALLFAGIGFVLIKNIIPPKGVGYVHIVLALIWFVKTTVIFTSDLIIINHSDNLLTLIVHIFTTAFLMSCARFYARTETKHSRMREINTAGIMFIISAAFVLSKGAALLFGGSAVKGMDGMDPNAFTALALSAAFLFVIFFTSGSKEIEYIVEKDKKKKDGSEDAGEASDE